MKTTTLIAIAAVSILAGPAQAALTTHSGTGSSGFEGLLSGLNVTEAVLEVGSGDGLLNEQTKKITRRVKTSTGWEDQVTYKNFVTDSPYELAFLNPLNNAVESEGQFAWQTTWDNNQTDWVDFSIELSGTILTANLGGLELAYDTAPSGRIDKVGFWFGGGTGEFMSFNGSLNGNAIAATNSDSASKWYLFELDEVFDLLTGQLKVAGSGNGYPWGTLSMMVKFFSSPAPIPTPEPSTIAFIGIGALGAISVLRRRKKAQLA